MPNRDRSLAVSALLCKSSPNASQIEVADRGIRFFFVWFLIPETKGLSLERMDDIFGVTEIARKVSDEEAAPRTIEPGVNHTSENLGQSPPLHGTTADAPTGWPIETREQREKITMELSTLRRNPEYPRHQA